LFDSPSVLDITSIRIIIKKKKSETAGQNESEERKEGEESVSMHK
jgi:hypothetical protein